MALTHDDLAFASSACPWYRSRSGFGSNVSTWLTPPDMKSEITAVARGSKCGLRDATGESGGAGPRPHG